MNSEQVNSLDKSALRNVFINQLSLLYAAKVHLTKSLPALVDHAAFAILKQALNEDIDDSKKQMLSLSEVFKSLNESAVTENCLGMEAIMKEAYQQVLFHNGQNYESDMSIIFYMGVIEYLQIGAGRMLNLIAKNKDYQQYTQLVKETLDMSADNANLFQLIATEYLQEN